MAVLKQSPDDLDDLFQLPPDQFTAARNDLAARLKAAGKADEAARVKGLSKPPVSAWVVNQLFWKKRKSFDRLMAEGARLVKAQAAQLKGKSGDLREPLQARRKALEDLARDAAALMRQSGHTPSPDLMRRVTTTLEALATYAGHPSAPRPGYLTDDVDAPGFEALAALIPKGPAGRRHDTRKEPPKILQFARKTPPPRGKTAAERKKQDEAERKAREAAARAAIKAAEEALAMAKKDAARAEAALKQAAAKAKQAERAKEALSARYEKLTADADQARTEARKVAAEAEDAAQAVEDAERALDAAKELAAGSRQ